MRWPTCLQPRYKQVHTRSLLLSLLIVFKSARDTGAHVRSLFLYLLIEFVLEKATELWAKERKVDHMLLLLLSRELRMSCCFFLWSCEEGNEGERRQFLKGVKE